MKSDAASMADVAALAGTVADKLGAIDALFVNVGISELAPFTAAISFVPVGRKP